MFTKSVEIAKGYTRCIKSIMRGYGSNEITAFCSTLIMVNDEGWALTCRHVIEGVLIPEGKLAQSYNKFKQERSQILSLPKGKQKKKLDSLEKQYGYSKSIAPIVQLKNNVMVDFDASKNCTFYVHPTCDLALIKFEGFNPTQCSNYPVFKDISGDLKQGLSLCRLGYPFAEFTDYQYNTQTDDIEWVAGGSAISPYFPIEGILTRFVADNGIVSGIEISTPGLKGQSGGPLFDKDGVVCGLQYGTVSIPLGFDQVNREIFVEGKKKKVSNHPFMHLGRCVHVDIIKKFMDDNGVKYQKG